MRIKPVLAVLAIFGFAVIVYADTLEPVLTLKSGTETSFLKIEAELSEKKQLLWDGDDLSSGWLFSIDGIVYSPADAGWVREEEKFEGGQHLSYSNRVFSMDQQLILSAKRLHALLRLRFTNHSEKTVNFAPSLLWDTSLGEPTAVPFRLSDGSAVVAETERTGHRIPEWIESEPDGLGPSLIICFDGTTADKPRRIVMANWLRLKQNGPDPVTEEGRSFDYPPFSENDSALLIQYDGRRLAPGASMELTVIFGLEKYAADAVDFDAVFEPEVDSVPEDLREVDSVPEDLREVDSVPEDLREVDSVPEDLRLKEYTIQERLRDIDARIDAVDSLLNGENEINADSVAEVEAEVSRQEKLLTEYENL